MAEYPALPLWTDAYLGDTTHLTTTEHGAYLLLIMAMWRTSDCALPADDRLLARYAKLTLGQWSRMKPVLVPFFREENGVLTQGRLTDEREAVRQRSTRQSDKAKARWRKDKGKACAAALPDECQTDASHIHTHNHKEKGDSYESPKKPASRKGSRLPEDWFLPVEWGRWALDQGMPEAAIREEAEKFRDYWIAQPGQRGVKLDWQATWRNWLRNSQQRKGRTNGTGHRGPVHDPGAAARLAKWDELDARLANQADGLSAFGGDPCGAEAEGMDSPEGHGPVVSLFHPPRGRGRGSGHG